MSFCVNLKGTSLRSTWWTLKMIILLHFNVSVLHTFCIFSFLFCFNRNILSENCHDHIAHVFRRRTRIHSWSSVQTAAYVVRPISEKDDIQMLNLVSARFCSRAYEDVLRLSRSELLLAESRKFHSLSKNCFSMMFIPIVDVLRNWSYMMSSVTSIWSKTSLHVSSHMSCIVAICFDKSLSSASRGSEYLSSYASVRSITVEFFFYSGQSLYTVARFAALKDRYKSFELIHDIRQSSVFFFAPASLPTMNFCMRLEATPTLCTDLVKTPIWLHVFAMDLLFCIIWNLFQRKSTCFQSSSSYARLLYVLNDCNTDNSISNDLSVVVFRSFFLNFGGDKKFVSSQTENYFTRESGYQRISCYIVIRKNLQTNG